MQSTSSFITAFNQLGQFLGQFPEGGKPRSEVPAYLSDLNKEHLKGFIEILENEPVLNPWFTTHSLMKALKGIASMLEEEVLKHWLEPYGIAPLPSEAQRTVGLVLAGNIPLVGFHDMMSVLAAGHRVLAKPSSKDDRLIRKVAEVLTDIDPEIGERISFTDNKLSGMDAVIATGSNNSARYFEYYFRNVPSIIRRNRNSIAIIDGTESDLELEMLGDDIFSYFGLGCRNVSKLYLPRGYDPASLLPRWERFESLRSHYRYMVNYDHHRAVMIVNRESYIDGRFIMLRESSSLTPPMAVLHYEFYDTGQGPYKSPEMSPDLLQCIAGHGHLPFGTTQQPELWNYADNIDTISFLLKK